MAASVPNNLPAEPTSFIGRHEELAAVAELLSRARLVTLTGPPGTGKTRLALRSAATLAGQYPDGVWLAELASVKDPALIIPKVREALGVADTGSLDPLDLLLEHLRSRRVLLVIDNLEHLVENAAVLSRVVESAPLVTVLATSRETLRLTQEQEFRVPPLEVENGSQSAAARLFVERARLVRPSFIPTKADDQAIERICATLDGLPLAIELAAARLRVMSPAAVAGRLEERLSLLQGGPRDVPERHRSLRAAIAWSYDLLAPVERTLFRRLSAFHGMFDLDAIEAVCDPEALGVATLDGISSLVDKNLVRAVSSPDGSVRFAGLQTIRDFAAEQLDAAGETNTVRIAHARYFLDLLEELAPRFVRRGRVAALDRLERDHDNIRAAHRWAIEAGLADMALAFSAGMWRFWQVRGHIHEGTDLTERSLAIPGGSESLTAGAGTAAGALAYWRADFDKARDHYLRALEVQRQIGTASDVARAIYDLSFSYFGAEEVELRRHGGELVDQALELFRSAGDDLGAAHSLWAKGLFSGLQGDFAHALTLFSASTEALRRTDDEMMLAWSLQGLGNASIARGDYETAESSYREAMELFRDARDYAGIEFVLDCFARLAIARGDSMRALRLAAAAATMRRVSGEQLGQATREALGDELRTGRPLGDEDRRRAIEEGAALSIDEAVSYALGTADQRGPSSGLSIKALGPFQVESPLGRVGGWGAGKAGARQALAIFGFLFDRGRRGVTKDEVIELLWPDSELKAADLAFHRTLHGLRRTLGGSLAATGPTVEFAQDRYRLVSGLVTDSDVQTFEELIATAEAALDANSALETLERARALYRGDYLDDCPIYGDTAEVEQRREYLRARLVDVLVSLGDAYEARGDISESSACFRQAIDRSTHSDERALAGLTRLGASV